VAATNGINIGESDYYGSLNLLLKNNETGAMILMVIRRLKLEL